MGIMKLLQRVCPIDQLRPTNSDLTFDSLSCSAYNMCTLYFHFQRGTESSFGRQLFDAARKSFQDSSIASSSLLLIVITIRYLYHR
jgi:hypothetical protein